MFRRFGLPKGRRRADACWTCCNDRSDRGLASAATARLQRGPGPRRRNGILGPRHRRDGQAVGEVCFNTSITGYQEILTDPSYAAQIITFTFPHIGMSARIARTSRATTPAARGLVIRNRPTEPANYRAEQSLDSWLRSHRIIGVYGVDTRRLTRLFATRGRQTASSPMSRRETRSRRDARRGTRVARPRRHGPGARRHLPAELRMARDGMAARRRLRHPGKAAVSRRRGRLRDKAQHPAHARRARLPRNGRAGRPRRRKRSCAKSRRHLPVERAGRSGGDSGIRRPGFARADRTGKPIFGICFGHQLLSLALGGTTRKMDKGHRGANHPVKDRLTGKVEITSQNHGFVVDPDSLPDTVEATQPRCSTAPTRGCG